MTAPQIQQIDLKDISPMQLFSAMPEELRNPAFLLSDGTQGSRYSLLAAEPVDWLKGKLQQTLRQRHCDYEGPLPFVGGMIGSIDYEYGYHCLDLPAPVRAENLLLFAIYDQVLIFDHQVSSWYEVRRGDTDRMRWKEWPLEEYEPPEEELLQLEASWSFDAYRQRFDQLQEAIRLGEIYQACLTFPFHGPAVRRPRALFARLFQEHPAPMAAYLEHPQREIMSLSPERFIHWDGHRLESKPIKGTRPRGHNATEDEAQRQDILQDEKERAELNMITDLLRNDMAKVSLPGSVRVLEHQALQKSASVWHTYSEIVSKSRPGIDIDEILNAMLPGGSISGCPKRRAVRLLSELEDQARGIYTGCIGYISDHGAMDLSIAIRTLEQKTTGIQAGFGGGIVYDSAAEDEYAECFAKAKPFLKSSSSD